MPDCAKKVNEMMPICKAFSYQLAANSPDMTALSEVGKQVCKDCEVECRKHDDKHTECKECGDACEQVVAAIDAMSAFAPFLLWGERWGGVASVVLLRFRTRGTAPRTGLP